MKGIRFTYAPPLKWVPEVSGLTSLWKLNLSTFVTVDKRTGIYFFTSDTDSPMRSRIAKRFFHQSLTDWPALRAKYRESDRFNSQRSPLSVEAAPATSGESRVETELDHRAKDRYRRFNKDLLHISTRGRLCRGSAPSRK
jgi:uncharacterized protein YqjF (DUF2071 family)